MTQMYLKETHGCILSFPITSKHKYFEVYELYQKIKPFLKQTNYPMIIAGGRYSEKEKREVSIEECQAFAEEANGIYFEYDAKANINCFEILNYLMDKIVHNDEEQNNHSSKMSTCSLL